MQKLARLNVSSGFHHVTDQSGVMQLMLRGLILGGESQYNYYREQL